MYTHRLAVLIAIVAAILSLFAAGMYDGPDRATSSASGSLIVAGNQPAPDGWTWDDPK